MLTVPEAARIARRNPETIRRWIRSGKLRSNIFGTQHMIDEIELDELLNGVRAVNVPAWLDGPGALTGWTPDELMRFVREAEEDLR